MIEFQNICKTYRVAKRQAGFTNAVKSLFSREYETIHALDDVSFRITDGGVVFGQRTQLWWDVPAIDSFELLRDMYKTDDKLYRKNLDELTRRRSHNLRKYEDERVQSKPADNHILPVSAAIAGFASQTELLDVSVTDISTEEVVAALYKEYHI